MSRLTISVTDKDHMQGDKDAPIELVEYGDYQCPYCGKAYQIVKEVQQVLGDNLKFVFRNFPLSQMHEHALNAAIASEVAGAQGYFWEMHDLLYENQNALDDQSLIKYAGQAGCDISKFEQHFSDPEFTEKVQTDFQSGAESGVNGTPSFFINGEKYDGSWDAASLIAYLESL